MILRSLELKHFGKFAEKNFDFRRGMNLVVGPNEAGKSTIMEAIPAVLFGVRNKERFKPWGRQGSCEAALVLEEAGRTVRLERDILTDRVCLTERDDLYHVLYQFEGKASPQGRSSERAEYLEQLQRLFGVADDDLFRASLFFGQGSLEVSGQGGMSARIKTLLSGFVEVDYDRVLESLAEDYFSITRSNPWGKDKTRSRELEELRERLETIEQRWFDARGGIEELEKVRAESAGITTELERQRDDYQKGERYLAWVRKQWQLEEKEKSLRKDFDRVSRQSTKIGQLQEERQNVLRGIEKTGLPADLPADLPIILQEADEIRREMVSIQGETVQLREKLLALRDPSWRLAAALAGLLLGTAGALTWWRPQWMATSLLAGGLLTALVCLVYLWQAGKARGERNRLKGQGQILERNREEAQARLAELDERFAAIGMRPSAVEIARMQKNIENHRVLVERLRELDSALEVLEESEDKEEKEGLTRELAVITERLEKERPLQKDAMLDREELPEAEQKLQKLGETIKENESRLLELARREATLQGDLAGIEQLEEEGERLRHREKHLRGRCEALRIACDLLSSAVDEFRQTYLERFAGEISRHLAMVTLGRHETLRLEDDFSLYLKGRGNGWRPVEHFSRGTIDAVYFAVRLALTRQLSSGRLLPLLLDDPLVNFDRGRLGETLNILGRLSLEHQVILFAHDESLLKRAARDRWNMVVLDSLQASMAESSVRDENAGQLALL